MENIVNGIDGFMENAANVINGLVGRVSPEEALIRRAINVDNHNAMIDRERIRDEINRLDKIINNNSKAERFSERRKEVEFYRKRNLDARMEQQRLQILLSQLQNQRVRRFEEEKN